MLPIRNLRTVLKPLLFLFRIFGLYCYSLQKETLEFKFYKRDFYSIVIAFLLFCIYFYSAVQNFKQHFTVDYLETQVDKITFYFQQTLVVILTVIHCLYFHVYRKNITKVIRSSYNIEKLLHNIQSYTNFKSIYKFELKSLLFFTVLIIYLIILGQTLVSESYFIITVNIIIRFTDDLLLCFLGVLLYDAKLKFYIVNQNIHQLKNVSHLTRMIHIEALVEIYNELKKHCIYINSIFNYYICGLFLSSMTSIIIMVYFLVGGLIQNNQYVFGVISWNIYILLKICYTLHIFNSTRNKVIFNRVKNLISKRFSSPGTFENCA